MGRFEGKRLLLLGTSVGTVDIIKYAQSEGAYVIVTDYLEKDKSEGKQYADESAFVSTTDIDALEVLCREKSIDVVFSGVSELNLLSAYAVNQRIGHSFYFTLELWEKFMNKDDFRKLCLKYDIPTPKTYFSGNMMELKCSDMTEILFPIILKPVDGCANKGVHVCFGQNEINEMCEDAFMSSKSSEIIIEQYVEGIEVSCTYVLQGDKCRLVCMGDKYAYENENKLKALSNAYVYPSNHLEEYFNSGINERVCEMFCSEGIKDCTVFLQGIYAGGNFFFFEAGLRMEGTASYKITEHMNGQNFMRFMVDRLFETSTEYDVNKEDVHFGGKKCVYFSLIVGEGTIGSIHGLECLDKLSNVVSYTQRHKIGEHIVNDGTLRQLMFRFVIVDDEVENMIKSVRIIQNNVKVLDEDGNSMLIEGFDASILKKD